MQVISDSATLARFCRELENADFVTLDTEFIREKTYYPKLCLVQLAGPDQAAAIDPLAPGIDLTPLFTLLQNPALLKVLHASRQDIEIFYYLTGQIPTPLFDTQIAAQVCGFGESVGYESLVGQLLGKSLDKSSRFTDWSQRPLTQKQIDYAISDVTHLRDIYGKLKARIDNADRMGWIEEEIHELSNPDLYRTDPEEAWRRIKARGKTPRFCAILKEMARWREQEAIRKDIPRGRLIKDDVMVEIASCAPLTKEELFHVRAYDKRLNAPQTEALLAAIAAGKALPQEQCPRLPAPKAMPEGSDNALDLLKLILKIQCRNHGVAQSLVANSDDLEDFLLGVEDIPIRHGWRWDVYGKHAADFLEGKAALSYDPEKRSLSVMSL